MKKSFINILALSLASTLFILQSSVNISNAQDITPDSIVSSDAGIQAEPQSTDYTNHEESVADSSIYEDAEFVPNPYTPSESEAVTETPDTSVTPSTPSTPVAPSTPSAPQTPNTPSYKPPKKGSDIGDLPQDAKVIDAPYINQRASYPNGCEAVTAVMLLQYLGVDISASEFINSHLDMGRSPFIRYGEWYACDPREQYPGNPANSSGWGCYPEVIKKAVDSLAPQGFETFVLKDTPLSTLVSEYLDNGIPVAFWGTIDMKKPREHVTWNVVDSDKKHTWISPFHCLLLVGYDSEGYYFNDPWQDKLVHYKKKAVELAYSGMGREALVVLPTESVTESTDAAAGGIG